MTFGIATARRGWVEKKDVLNALECDELLLRLKACKVKRLKRGA
jgi:hypothetical protein